MMAHVLSQKSLLSIKKCIFNCDNTMTSPTTLWPMPWWGNILYNAKFRVCIFSSFKSVMLKKAIKHKMLVASSIVIKLQNYEYVWRLCCWYLPKKPLTCVSTASIFYEIKENHILIDNYGVIMDHKKMKLVKVGKWNTGFYLNSKWHSLVKNYKFEKIIFNCDANMMASPTSLWPLLWCGDKSCQISCLYVSKKLGLKSSLTESHLFRCQ